MSPHALGTKKGTLRGLFLQSEPMGPSNDLRDQWRCMDLELLEDVEVFDEAWTTAGSHTRKSSCMDRVDVEVTH